MAYRVAPYTKEETPTESAPVPTNEVTLDEKVDRLEKMLTALVSKGGKFDGLL